MICEKCRHVNKDYAGVCKYCGAPLESSTAAPRPRNARVSIPSMNVDEEEFEKPVNNKKFVAVISALGILVAACIAVFAFFLFGESAKSAPTTAPTQIPTQTVAPTLMPTPVPTTTPAPTDDISSLFTQPTNLIGQ